MSGRPSYSTVLVVPSNRPEQLVKFLHAWSPWPWDATVVAFDGLEIPASVIADAPDVDRSRLIWVSHSDLDRLGEKKWIFSRGDSAFRSFGFLEAFKLGANYVLTLDDDCLPAQQWQPKRWLSAHLDNLTMIPTWQSTVPGMNVRGMPVTPDYMVKTNSLSLGLWEGKPDLPATEKIRRPVDNFVPPSGVRVMSPHQYFPMSGMNLAFRSSIMPLMYFPLMGQGQKYARFDDVWCGIVAQFVLKHLNRTCAVGEPFVFHDCQSDPHRAAEKEEPGLHVHDHVSVFVDRCPTKSISDSMSGALAVSQHFKLAAEHSPDLDYFRAWGEALAVWCSLLDF